MEKAGCNQLVLLLWAGMRQPKEGYFREKLILSYPGRSKRTKKEVGAPQSYLRAHPQCPKDVTLGHWALPLRILSPPRNITLRSKPLTHGPLRDIFRGLTSIPEWDPGSQSSRRQGSGISVSN